MKHLKKLTLIILTLSLLLCGCGGTKTNDSNDNNENSSTNNTNDNPIIEKDEYSFSEYISSGETIWFLTNGVGKDADIENILVINTDGSVYYYFDTFSICYGLDLTLGEVEQMDDAEIISIVKQTYNEKVTERLSKWMEFQGKEYDLSILLTDPKPLLTPYLENIKPAQYKLGIISDSTGNNTEKEVFVIQDYAPLTMDRPCLSAKIVKMELSYIYPYESNNGSTNSYQVYDSWYGGYSVDKISYENTESGSESNKYYFITRMDSNKIFKFDEVGTENIGIDNIDSLFEEISIELEWRAAEPGEW